MNIYLYVSQNYPYTGRLTNVLKDLSYAKFYFNQSEDALIKIINNLDLTAEYFENSKLYNVLRQLNYILIFYNEEDNKAVQLSRYAAKKAKNLIIIPEEEKPYV